MNVGYIEVDTKLNTDGIKEGIEEIKDEYSDEEIEFVSKDQESKFNFLSKVTSKIGTKLRGGASRITGISSVILKVIGKIGLIGGIIGALLLVGTTLVKAFNTAIQKNDELKTKVDYIKFSFQSIYEVIGEKLVGFINWILNAIIKVLSYIGGIVKAMTGINIFAKATKENFKAMQNSANAIRKSFAGFDEMETLDDSGGLGLTKDINGLLSKIPDLANEVDQIGEKIKGYFSIPTPQEFVKEVDEKILKPTQIIWDNTIGKLINIIWEKFSPMANWIYENVILPIWNDIVSTYEPIYDWFKSNVFDPISNFISGEFWNNIKQTYDGWYITFYNIFIDFINSIIRVINETFGIFGVHIDELEHKTIETNENIEESIVDNVIDNIKEAINEATNLSNGEYEVNIANTKINEAETGLSKILKDLQDVTKKIWTINAKTVMSGEWLGNLGKALADVGIKLPKLAGGGIVNLPSRGVPVGGAMTGERGAEGIIPLTDSQQMELLGEAIGKYITVNASITNTMNGRVISREIQRIQNESDFAFNG